MAVEIKRIYDSPQKDDGYRILVDRLWPRGVTKERAALDAWLKEAAPSSELRTWFGHDPAKFKSFRKRYLLELEKNSGATELLQLCKKHPRVTLLYAAKDPKINHALVLQEFIQHQLS